MELLNGSLNRRILLKPATIASATATSHDELIGLPQRQVTADLQFLRDGSGGGSSSSGSSSGDEQQPAAQQSPQVFCICRRAVDDDDGEDDDIMIECEICKDWLHGRCVDINPRIAADIEVYVCPRCASETHKTINKKRENFHRHDYSDRDAAKKAIQSGTPAFVDKLLERNSRFRDALTHGLVCKLSHGSELTLDYLARYGFERPILVEQKDGLRFQMPGKERIDLSRIETIVGSRLLLDVIDVERQQTYPMTISELNAYFRHTPRHKVYNLISFEISKTRLTESITAPHIVQEISWVSNGVWPSDDDQAALPLSTEMAPSDSSSDNCQPISRSSSSSNRKTAANEYIVKPEVQKYCLISAARSYTDFHIDFGGSSVWYHVVKGDKVFYLIEPTEAHLAVYERWNALKNHTEVFLADLIDDCYIFYVREGNTVFLPTGWIHAVYTPDDSLVFGGNFLQSYNIPLQLKIYEMELRLKTPDKYRFPAFETLQWYAVKFYTKQLKELNLERKTVDLKLFRAIKYLRDTVRRWLNSKDYYQTHDYEIPKRINCDKLIKIMGKELTKAEFLLKSSSADTAANGITMKTPDEDQALTQHSFVKASESPTEADDSKIVTASAEPTALPKKSKKEVLNFDNMNLFEIKIDNELEALCHKEKKKHHSHDHHHHHHHKEHKEHKEKKKKKKKEKEKEEKKNSDEQQTQTANGESGATPRLTLKISKRMATPSEPTFEEQIFQTSGGDQTTNDTDSSRQQNGEDAAMDKLLANSICDNDFVYPSLSSDKPIDKRSKSKEKSKKSAEVTTASSSLLLQSESDAVVVGDVKKSQRKRKIKPYAAIYLQPAVATTESANGGGGSVQDDTSRTHDADFVYDKEAAGLGDDEFDDDEDFKLKCKNNLRLCKKIKKSQTKKQSATATNDNGTTTDSASPATMNGDPFAGSRKKPIDQTAGGSTSGATANAEKAKKMKKGFVTTKQRLGKLLKLNRVVNI